jgi:aspartyl-tRNA(Asn)/glutamyl-tRNA(Gln) amidotransferase subunit A
MRYAPLANLTGIPGLSVPVGYDRSLLPIGLQLMGPWWQEHELLRLGRIVEAKAMRIAPNSYYDPLGHAMDYGDA